MSNLFKGLAATLLLSVGGIELGLEHYLIGIVLGGIGAGLMGAIAAKADRGF